MTKHRGPNSRKKSARRRERQRSTFKRFLPVLLAVSAVSIATILLIDRYGARLEAIADRLKAIRDPDIERIEVRGSLALVPDELLHRFGLSLPMTLGELRKQCREKIGAAQPWIEKIQVVRSRGGTATVCVSERTPIALLQSGSVRLVDAEGYLLPLRPGVTYDLPLVSGLRDSVAGSGVHRLHGRDQHRLSAFSDELNRCDTAFTRAVSQMDFRGDGRVLLSFQKSPTVVVVHEGAAAEGFDRLTRILATIAAEATPARMIDCSYGTIAFVTPGEHVPVAAVRRGAEGKSKG